MSISFKPFVRILPTPATIESSLRGTLSNPPTFLVHANAQNDYCVELAGNIYGVELDHSVKSPFLTLTKEKSAPLFVGSWTPTPDEWKGLTGRNKRVYYWGRTKQPREIQYGYNFIPTPYWWRSLEKRYQDVLSTRTSSGKLPRLTIEADKILRNGKPVVLRGVNLSGLQHRDPFRVAELQKAERREWHKATGFTEQLVSRLREEGVEIVRVLLNQQYVLDDVGLGPPELDKEIAGYLSSIDELIRWCTDKGIYTLLCLHSLAYIQHSSASDCYDEVKQKNTLNDDPEFGTAALVKSQPFTPPMPDAMSPFFWSVLAERYAGHSGVLFDLLNEPHRPDEKENTPNNDSRGRPKKNANSTKPARRSSRSDEAYFLAWKHRDSLSSRSYQLGSSRGFSDRPIPATYDEAFWTEEWHQWVRYFDILIRGSNDVELGWGSPSRVVSTPERAERIVLFVAGIHGEDWSSNVNSMPVATDSTGATQLKDIVYKPHFYQRTSSGSFDTALTLSKPGSAPIFVGEWGTWTTESIRLRQDFPAKGASDSGANKEFLECIQRGSIGEKQIETFRSGDDEKVPAFLEWAKKLIARMEVRPVPKAPTKESSKEGEKKPPPSLVSGWTAWSVGDWPDILVKKDADWERSFDPFTKTETMGTWVFRALKFKIRKVDVMLANSKVSPTSEIYEIRPGSEFELVAEIVNGLDVLTPTVEAVLFVEDQFRDAITIVKQPVSGFADGSVRATLRAERSTKDIVAGRDHCVLTMILDGVAFVQTGDAVSKTSIRVK